MAPATAVRVRGDVVPASGGRRPGDRWREQFLLLSAIWGTSFLFIKIGVGALAPVQVALGRLVLGLIPLLAVLAFRRDPFPRDLRAWGHLFVGALLLSAGPFTLYAYGETQVSSVLAGIWNATTPLLTAAVAMLVLPDERPTRARVAGLLVGFAGVLVVLGAWRGVGGHALLGNLACLAAAACYGLGFPYTRRHLAGRPESVVSLAAAQLVCATAQLAVVAPLVSGAPRGLPARVVLSVVALGVLGTGVAYILNYAIIRAAGATVASTVTYVIPLFSTVAGVVVLGERLTWNQPVGALVVLAGVAVSQGRLGPLVRGR